MRTLSPLSSPLSRGLLHSRLQFARLFPVVAMLGEACWREERLVTLLRELGATPLLVPELRDVRCSGRRYGPDSRPLAWNASTSYFDATYTILAAWNLTQYRAVLVLDSDLALRQSLDHVLLAMLARPEIAEARTPEGCLDAVSVGPLRGNYFNTGVWGVRPDAHVWAALVRWLQSGTREHQCGIGIQTAAKGFFSATRIDPWRLDPPKDCCQEWREMNDVDRAGNHRRRRSMRRLRRSCCCRPRRHRRRRRSQSCADDWQRRATEIRRARAIPPPRQRIRATLAAAGAAATRVVAAARALAKAAAAAAARRE